MLKDALSLWQGPALAGAFPGPPLQAAAHSLEESRLVAVEQLARAHSALGEHDRAAAVLRTEAVAHPMREPLAASLMTALYRAGRQSEALDWFHRTNPKMFEQFHEEHKDVYRAEVEAAQRLADTLGKNMDAVNRAAMADPSRADDVVDAFKDVASSPLPAVAAEWAAKTFEDGSPAARVFADHAEEVRTDTVEKAMAGALTQYQGEAGGLM